MNVSHIQPTLCREKREDENNSGKELQRRSRLGNGCICMITSKSRVRQKTNMGVELRTYTHTRALVKKIGSGSDSALIPWDYGRNTMNYLAVSSIY